MRSRGLLAFTVVVAAFAVAAWFAWRGEEENASVANASRAAARGSADPISTERAGAEAAKPEADAAKREVEPAATTNAGPNARRIFGRVVDARRFPVVGARVRFTATGREPVEVTSSEGGAFEFAFASVGSNYLYGALLATGPDGARGDGRAVLYPDRDDGKYDDTNPRDGDAHTITILPPARLVVHVRDDHGPVAGADLTAEVSSGDWFPIGVPLPVVVTDADGFALLAAPRCDATVIASLPGRATARTWTTCESGTEQSVELLLHATKSATIRVRDAATNAPVANAHIKLGDRFIRRQSRDFSWFGPEEVSGEGLVPDLVCDESGVAHFDDFDPQRSWSLRASAPGYEAKDGARARLDAASSEVELRLTSLGESVVRLPIVAADAPVPADGSVIELRRGSNVTDTSLPSEARIEHGELVITGATENQHVGIAVAPDGALAEFNFAFASTVRTPVQFRKPRALELHLHFADGRVAARAIVAIGYGDGTTVKVRADDEGRAFGHDLLPRIVQISEEGRPGVLAPLASADLRADDASIDVVVPERFDAVLSVTLDGRPGLPPTFRVGSGMAAWKVESEDPARGELRVSSSAGAQETQVETYLSAPTYLAAKVEVPVVRDGAPPVVPVALLHGATLWLDVKRATNQKFGLRLQKLGDDEKFKNIPFQFRAIDRVNGPNGRFQFAPLEAGTWRVLDEVTQLASEPVVLATGEERSSSLDISGAIVIHGRVIVPAGTEYRDVRIIARDEPDVVGTDPFARTTYPGTFVKSDFTFERTLDGAKPFVRAWHPSLTPPAGDPFVEVRDATQAVELALVDKPSLAFTLVRAGGAIETSRWDLNDQLSITLDREDGDHAHVTRSSPTTGAASEVVHLSEIPPGRWTLFLDPGGEAAPLLRAGIELEEDGTDLGKLELGPGSVLRLTVTDGRANRSASLRLLAKHVGAPEYKRYSSRSEGSALLLPGLGAGTFEILLSDSTGKQLWTGTAECDGAHETPLAIELH